MSAKSVAGLVVLSFAVLVVSLVATSRQRALLAEFGSSDANTSPPRAGFWIRLAARFADSLPLWTCAAVTLILGAAVEAAGAPAWVWLPVLMAPAAFFVLYFARATAGSGQTWGKRLAGVRVQRLEGGLLPRDAAVGRAVVDGVFLLLAQFVVGAVDALWALGRQRRALHDLTAHSVVVATAPPRRLLPVMAALGAVAPVALLFGLVRSTALASYFIPSGTMAPTLLPGDSVIANKLAYRLRPVHRGDIVIFRAPPAVLARENEGKLLIKRVVALPGDRVLIRHGEGVFVNGGLLKGPPGVSLPEYDWPTDEFGAPGNMPYTVPPGHCFVLGDNHNHSYDSARWRDPKTGSPRPALPLSQIIGKVTFRLYPSDRMGEIR